MSNEFVSCNQLATAIFTSLLMVYSSACAAESDQVAVVDGAPEPATFASMPSSTNHNHCDDGLAAALIYVADGQLAAGGGQWTEALQHYAQADQRLQALAARCSLEIGAGISESQITLSEKRTVAEAGLHRTTCLPAMSRALDMDTRAATLQAEKKEWVDIENLFAQAEATWQEAASLCLGSSRELALSNKADSARARAKAASFLGNGGVCDKAMMDASRMVDLAKVAWNEKTWEDASMWYRKAGMAWEAAAEKCAEPKRSQAIKKKESALIDAHNAISCVPAWESANALSLKLRSLPRDVGEGQKSELRNQVELSWMDAASHCRGSPQEKARANADLLAQERGVAPLPTPVISVPVLPSGTAATPLSAPLQPAVPAAISVAVAPVAAEGKPLLERTSSGQTPAPRREPVAASGPASGVQKFGNAIYAGQFQANPTGGKVSGTGRIEWDNGDVFVGTVVEGKAEGQGVMAWNSGNRYEGQWRNDLQNGPGVTIFADGSRYEGDHLDGQMTGRGIYQFGPTGDRYEGEILAGQPNGKGTYIWKEGNRYEGAWKLGVRSGYGKFFWANVGYWEGRFENDLRTDDGKMVFANSD